MVAKLLILFAKLGVILCGICPKPEVIYPCICNNQEILCRGGNNNLKKIFENLSKNLTNDQKHFDTFELFDNYTEIEDNTFYDITFKTISFINCNNLSIIRSNAFKSFAGNVEIFYEDFDSKLGEEPYVEELFNALMSLVNVKKIEFCFAHLKSIPDHAFKSTYGEQKNLMLLRFDNQSPPKPYIHTIGKYAFHELNNLTFLGLGNQIIDFVPQHAFDFHKSSNNVLDLYLNNNTLNSSSFELGAFLNAKRPINLDLSGNPKLTYLDEKVFAPYFRINNINSIFINEKQLVCDCNMYWLLKYNEFKNQIKLKTTKSYDLSNKIYKSDIICSDGKSLWNHNLIDFEKC
jgi:hypothetical protein